MSVAFRRESDEEHKEPRFELPIPPGPNLVTASGLVLVREKAAALSEAVAAETDPVALEALRRDQRYWQTRAASAVLAPVADGAAVAFGCRVTARINGATRTIDIVGDDEADPAADRLAFSAPLARAMIGAEPDETIDFNGKPGAIEIIAVAAIPG
ncbi:MAG: nucleoside-diphosphate kinase [Sphingomonas sp. 28-66-16]|nr:MAG: nucleoside-diphosphate kinase [Sphingomonas sp. 28-66-16]